MSRWAREHPEEMEAIARLPQADQVAALRDAMTEGIPMKDHESTDLRGAAHLAEEDLGPTPGLSPARNLSGETRLSDPELPAALARIAYAIDEEIPPRPAVIRFCAEGSAYPLLFVPFDSIRPARPDARYPVASEIGVESGSVLVVRNAWGKTSQVWLNPKHRPVFPDWVMEWLVENPVDAIALTVFLNLLQVARFGERESLGAGGLVHFMEHVDGWLERIGRDRFDRLGADLSVAELAEKIREAMGR